MSCATLFTTIPAKPSIPRITTTTKHHRSLSPERLATLVERSKTTTQVLQIHAYLIRHGLETQTVLNFKLQRSYASFDRVNYSVVLFRLTENPDVYFYTAIIHCHAVKNLHQEALCYYIQMLAQNVEPNAFTYSALLKSCPLKIAKILHSQVVKLGFVANAYVRTALVDVYASGGDLASARQLFDKNLVSRTAMISGYVNQGDLEGARLLFDKMDEKERDVVSWNVMFDGYTQNARPNEALVLFRRMLSVNMRPDEVTVVAVLSACGQLGALESGRIPFSLPGASSFCIYKEYALNGSQS
ncbi:hypothetical protein RJ639_033368 [Escallonia herrerae]|uniref:Pentatricopeptide repeat-containing protein n=1 Tax=Escallonia herrerae TaxID=1293975 RepID=A0AA88X302_9ASTE|nr:hypothetical protein RJ639_033368 [Escallonia herrerae]